MRAVAGAKHAFSDWSARFARSQRRFVTREDGTITVFSTMIFVLMVGIGGIAVDIMRYETQRAQLQNTLDRAVLAAASLTQVTPPRTVVQNYFDAAGLENYRLRVTIDEGVNFRRVNAIAEMELQSIFMRMFGVRVLTSPAAGAAEERIQNVEVSLVLDISGSMGQNSRMARLRPAAREFITTILEGNDNPDDDQRVSVSIVPYNGHVNMGTTLASVFSLTNEHNFSRCSRFYSLGEDPSDPTRDDFATGAIDPDVPIQRMGHFDRSTNWWDSETTIPNPRCPTDDYGAILPWSNSEADLHAAINNFGTQGTTAIDAGMKWALGLLDPAAQDAVTDLVIAGEVDPDFIGRPAAYNDNETVKIIVLMTDGANTQQYDLVEHRRSGPSPFWRDPDGEGDISVYYDNWDMYWWEDHDEWRNVPDGGSDNDAYQMDWAEVWHRIPVRIIDTYWFDEDAYEVRQPDGSSNWWRRHVVRARENDYRVNDIINQYVNGNGTASDARLEQICDVAQANGVIIFTIAFEAPPRGEDVMRHCASSDLRFYDVDGVEISDAFESIANTINFLRLVQ